MDIVKLVPMDSYEMVISMAKLIKESPVPYYVKGDSAHDNPLACVRLLQVAGAWEVRVYGYDEIGTGEEFAVHRTEYDSSDDKEIALIIAYNTFNSIHEVLSVTQLQNAGFVIQ